MFPIKRFTVLLALLATVAYGAPPSIPPFKTSQANVDTLVNQAGSGAPNFSQGLTATAAKNVQADNFVNSAGTGAPTFLQGLIATATKTVQADNFANTAGTGAPTFTQGLILSALKTLQADIVTNAAGTGQPKFTQGFDVTEISTPSAPASGVERIYAKTDHNLYFQTPSGTETQVGSGSGQKNYLQTGSNTAASWTASGAGITITTDTTSADLPRPNTTKTGIKFTGISGSTAFGYYDFVLDQADYNKKLQLQFDMACGDGGVTSTCAASDFKVDVFSCTIAWSSGTCSGTSTRLALSTDSSAVSALPNLTGTYRTAFDSPGSAAANLQVQVGLNATQTHSLVLSDVVAGPGIVSQGAAVSGWTNFTPTFVNTSSLSINSAKYRRVGDSIDVNVDVSFTNLTTNATTFFNLDSTGFTPDTSQFSNRAAFGAATINCNTNNYTSVLQFSGSNYTAGFRIDGQAFNLSGTGSVTQPSDCTTNTGIRFEGHWPVTQWAGSGTVNVVQNDVEYAYETGTWDASGSTTGYGPGGATISGSLTANRAKTITWLTPIQAGDRVSLEFDVSANGTWLEAGSMSNGGDFINRCFSLNSEFYGACARQASATQTEAQFNHYMNATSAATYGAAGTAWSTITNAKWRLKKEKAGVAVGFGAATATATGLVSYEDSGTFTATFTGARSTSLIIHYSRVGKIVALTWTDNVGSSCSASTFTSGSTDVPAALRPTAGSLNLPVVIQDNGALQSTVGGMGINTTGGINIVKSFGTNNFTNAANCGIFSGAVSYNVN